MNHQAWDPGVVFCMSQTKDLRPKPALHCSIIVSNGGRAGWVLTYIGLDSGLQWECC